MAEEEQKILMKDATDKASDNQQAAPQEDAYAGIMSEDMPKETQRPGGTLAHS
jgi:hypothetical protein